MCERRDGAIAADFANQRFEPSKIGSAPHPPFGHLLPVNGEKEEAFHATAARSAASTGAGVVFAVMNGRPLRLAVQPMTRRSFAPGS